MDAPANSYTRHQMKQMSLHRYAFQPYYPRCCIQFEIVKVCASSSQVTLPESTSTTKVVQPDRVSSGPSKHPKTSELNITSKSQQAPASGSEPPTASSSKKPNCARRKPCRYWKATGKCDQGNKCHFLHGPQVYSFLSQTADQADVNLGPRINPTSRRSEGTSYFTLLNLPSE